ncbi:MAG: class I SAM-dependent methyltransferase [Candidatus Thermoplasmatota archaeon]|nr:class I SAM-dependent methyltransferase [Candidatus Thermoplasmatota archaeon]
MGDEYGFTAKIYDPLFYVALNSIRKAVMKELTDHRDANILDLCCGTGNQLKMLSKNGFSNLHCLDLSEPMLKIARRGAHSLVIHKEDAAKTGFEDNEFDIVILSFALHEKNRKTQENILREVYRVMKDDGSMIVVDFIFDERSIGLGRLGAIFIERMAGGEHYLNFKRYKKSGGLSAIIDRKMFRNVKNIRKAFTVVTISTYRKSENS